MIFSCKVAITFFVLLLIVGGASFASRWTHEAEYVKRFGSLMAAVAALLVIVQVFVETRMNEVDASEASDVDKLSPQNREQALVMHHRRIQDRKESRLGLVLCVAMIAAVGEILHGWGDILFFPVSAPGEKTFAAEPHQDRSCRKDESGGNLDAALRTGCRRSSVKAVKRDTPPRSR